MLMAFGGCYLNSCVIGEVQSRTDEDADADNDSF